MRKNPNIFKRLEKYIEHDITLADFTTMCVGGPARYLFRVRNQEEIPEILDWARYNNLSIFVLGGGSNIVVSDHGFSGLVLKIEISGIHCNEFNNGKVEFAVCAGEIWDSFVEYTVKKGCWGVENMSLIPGTVGAAAVQNVSAYGQEVMTVITKVRAYDMQENRFVELLNNECRFGFRKSIFNTTDMGRYIIVSINFMLNKKGMPNLARCEIVNEINKKRRSKGYKISRKTTLIHKNTYRQKKVIDYRQSEIREAVIQLRSQGKLLPKPNTVGNSGTFFQASLIRKSQTWQIFRKSYKNIGLLLALKILGCRWKYPLKGCFKLSSRLLIEACGLENFHYGSFSLFKTNCAVLVNMGDLSNATDILRLIKKVRTTVSNKTGVIVRVEPTLVGFTDIELKRSFYLPDHESKIPL